MIKNNKNIPQESEEQKKGWIWASPRQWLIAGITAAGVTLTDQIPKILIINNLEPHQYVRVIGSFLRLTFAQNTQGVFALNYGPSFLYILLPSIALSLVIVFLLRRQSSFVTILLGLILGGGIGNNLIDRIRLGYVVDWISVTIGKFRLSSFNIADAAIVIALSLLIIHELFLTRKGNNGDRKETGKRKS